MYLGFFCSHMSIYMYRKYCSHISTLATYDLYPAKEGYKGNVNCIKYIDITASYSLAQYKI